MGSLALVRLCRWRLRRARWAKIAWIGALLPALAVLAGVLGDEDPTATSEAVSLIEGGVGWSAWIGGGPIAWLAASDLDERNRVEGVEALVGLRGASRGALSRARWLAAMIEIALRIAAPWWIACAWLAVTLADARVAMAIASVSAFAAVAGAVMGAVASACGQWGGARGRSLFAAIVVLPWLVAPLWLGSPWSLPGMLARALRVLSHPLLALKVGA
jgi:hypothetical protein